MDEAKAPSWRCLRRPGEIQTSEGFRENQETPRGKVHSESAEQYEASHTGKHPLPKVVAQNASLGFIPEDGALQYDQVR